MILRDLIYQKEMLEKKIIELRNIMHYDVSENIAQELFVQLELLQAKKVNLNAVNNQVKLDLGGKKVIISTAIIIRDTMKDKMNILTDLITDNECQLDKLTLMKQRDDIYEEYSLLSHKIVSSDLSVKIGED